MTNLNCQLLYTWESVCSAEPCVREKMFRNCKLHLLLFLFIYGSKENFVQYGIVVDATTNVAVVATACYCFWTACSCFPRPSETVPKRCYCGFLRIITEALCNFSPEELKTICKWQPPRCVKEIVFDGCPLSSTQLAVSSSYLRESAAQGSRSASVSCLNHLALSGFSSLQSVSALVSISIFACF